MARYSHVLSVLLLSAAVVQGSTTDEGDEGSVEYVETLEPVIFETRYAMMIDPIDLKPASVCMVVSSVVGEDGREDNGPLGGRRDEGEDTSDPKSTISISGDVPAWMRNGARAVLEAAGVKLAEPGPGLVVRLLSLKLSEEKGRRSDWRGSVTLVADVRSPKGETCWSAEFWGSAKNWGNPKNIENYRETVNHALDRALADLVKDADFAEALCTKCK